MTTNDPDSASPEYSSAKPNSALQEDGKWTAEERIHHRTERLFWWTSLSVTAIAAAGAIYTVVITRQAANDAKRQADTAEAALLAQDRPWISVALSSPKPIDLTAVNSHAAFDIVLKNEGHSPAIGVNAAYKILNLKLSISTRYELTEHERAACQAMSTIGDMGAILAGSVNLFPGQTFTINQDNALSEINLPEHARADEAEDASSLFYATGCSTYKTLDDEKHHYTGFSYLLGSADTNGRFHALTSDSFKEKELSIIFVSQGSSVMN